LRCAPCSSSSQSCSPILVDEPNSVGWLLALAGVAALASVENDRWIFGSALRCLEAVVWAIGIHATGGDRPLLPTSSRPSCAAGAGGGIRSALLTAGFGVVGLAAGGEITDAGVGDRS
jgi:hypothetical protein